MSIIPEGPLVVFTIASELACGLALAAACLDLVSGSSDEAGAARHMIATLLRVAASSSARIPGSDAVTAK